MFTLWGKDYWHLLEDARGTDDDRFIMTSRQAVQGHLQLHTHNWSRGHHKQCPCEPYSAQAGAFTGSLHQQHLTGQDTAHSVSSSWRTDLVHFPDSSSIFFSVPTITYLLHWRLSSRYWKSCPIALKFASDFFEDLVTFCVYLHSHEGHWKFTLLQFLPFSNL